MQLDQRVIDTILRTQFVAFIEKAFTTVSPGQLFRPNWHVETIAWHLDQVAKGSIKRLIIILPPRYLKSICASVAFPAWVLGQDPARRVICVSYSEGLSRKHALDCRALMQSDWYRRGYPATVLDPRRDTEQEMMTTRRGFRFTTSLGGSLTGRGGDLIIIDDPLKPDDAMSLAERTRVNQWYDGTLYSRLDNKNEGAIVIIMQRLHEDDLVGHVLEMEEWVHLRIPAIAEEDMICRLGDHPEDVHHRRAGEVLHADHESRESLDTTRRQLGTANFEAQYQQAPVPPGGNMIDPTWFNTYDEAPPRDRFAMVVQSWDTASRAAEINDYSACITAGIIGQNYYVLDVVRERLTFPDLKARVLQEARKHRADAVLIEDAGSGISLLQELRRTTSLRPIGIKPKQDKITRMQRPLAIMQAGRVRLPGWTPWRGALMAELLAFPHGRYKDQADALSQLLNWLADHEHLMRPRQRPNPRRPQGHSLEPTSRTRLHRPRTSDLIRDLLR